MLLNFRAGKGPARADCTVVDQRTPLDDLGSMIDGDFRILKNTLCIVMSHAQFRDLARTTRGRILVALAAGLCVVQWPESVRHSFHFFEFGLVGAVRRVVDHTIAL